MKTSTSFRRTALAALALGATSITATFAQTTTTPAPATPVGTCDKSAGNWHHHKDILTADEKTQLKTARDIAFSADPSLKTEEDSLKQKFAALKEQGSNATKDDWAVLRTESHDFHEKLRTAELKANPTLQPVFAKLDAARKHFHHDET